MSNSETSVFLVLYLMVVTRGFPMPSPNMLFASILTFIATSLPAHAYLDPGTGSLIVQSLVGGVLAASTFTAFYMGKIMKVFRRITGRARPGDTDTSE
jgi:hypothetical protein